MWEGRDRSNSGILTHPALSGWRLLQLDNPVPPSQRAQSYHWSSQWGLPLLVTHTKISWLPQGESKAGLSPELPLHFFFLICRGEASSGPEFWLHDRESWQIWVPHSKRFRTSRTSQAVDNQCCSKKFNNYDPCVKQVVFCKNSQLSKK